MRLRKRAAGLVLGATVLFVIGTNVQAGMLFILAAMLLGALLAGIVMPFAALRGLEAELVAPEEASQGEPAMVELRLTNRGRGVRWSVLAVDAHLDPAEVFLPAIRPGGRAEVSTLRAPRRRGEVDTTHIEVRSAAPFGVAERRRRLPVQASTLVLPRVFPLGDLPFIEPVPTHELGIHTSPRLGHGPDYLGVREYRPGDPMRHVHWGLTARHGQVMVRELEEERTRRLAIVVDTERDEGETWTPLDRACAVAASLLEAAVAAGHGARLAAAVGDEVDVVSRADDAEMLRWLAELRPGGLALGQILARLDVDVLRGVGTIVVVAPAWPEGFDAGLASRLAALPADRVVFVPVMTEGTVVPSLAGVDVYPWHDGEDLAAALASGRAVVP